MQRPISWPDLGPASFALVVAFDRCRFKLTPEVVALILQATIGGSTPHFRVSLLCDRTFKLFVSSKDVGFFIHNLRSFSCDLYVLFFHLWGNGGLNWRHELRLFLAKEKLSWQEVQSVCKSSADTVKSMRPASLLTLSASISPLLTLSKALPFRAPILSLLVNLQFQNPCLIV